MTDEQTNIENMPAPEEPAPQAQKAEKAEKAESESAGPVKLLGFPKKKLIMFGGIGVGAILIIVVALTLFSGGDSPAEADAAATEAVAEESHDQHGMTSETSHTTEADPHAADPHELADEMALHGIQQPRASEEKPFRSAEDNPDSIIAAIEAELMRLAAQEEAELEDLTKDDSFLEQIEENLAFLDWQPEDEFAEERAQSKTDSIEAVDWIESETERLNKWEYELSKREKELQKLDREVSKKILVIEQAESTRIMQLARLYDQMDPRAVARLLTNLDDATVISILPRMKPKNASSALALLPSTRAASLSKQLITIAGN